MVSIRRLVVIDVDRRAGSLEQRSSLTNLVVRRLGVRSPSGDGVCRQTDRQVHGGRPYLTNL